MAVIDVTHYPDEKTLDNLPVSTNQGSFCNGKFRLQLLENAPGEGSCHSEDDYSIFISLASHPLQYFQKQDGKKHTGLYQFGDISIVPIGSSLFAQWEGHENCLQVSLSGAFIHQIAQETLNQNCDRTLIQPAFQTRNPQLESISTLLWREYQQGLNGNQLYTDSLANVLAIHLLRDHATSPAQVPTYEGGLPRHHLTQVFDYIDAHLGGEIKLADLAQMLNISQFHFGRMFKQSMGISPHQYLIQQRIERSKYLLKESDRLIVDIALECGFNSHSHLSKQFRQFTGVTPKAFRRSESKKAL